MLLTPKGDVEVVLKRNHTLIVIISVEFILSVNFYYTFQDQAFASLQTLAIERAATPQTIRELERQSKLLL